VETYQDIRYEVVEDPHIARITLARPERMNAYTPQLVDEVIRALGDYREDDELRVLILTGEGRGFCSGGDIRGGYDSPYRGHPMSHLLEMREGFHRLFAELRRLDKPVIAQVNGAAVAGGLTLALLCDIRIASDRARLGDTSGRAGLLPDEGGAYLFPRVMGLDRALRMSLLAEVYDAERALELGLVSEVVPHDELETRTLEVARGLAKMAPLAVRAAKRMMIKQLEMTWENALEDAALSVMITNPSQDAREGIRAFQEKREPGFEGR
jgi:2-(1,2-epoxy-1,2-dihydrophenyl)acetyl-CoA isomerase